ncbi:MAG: hypothetical protein JW747_07910 [Candidatus Aminicenantes bacterium]|nr:hypothetical protein [Candidatus Aminicenantes bacterium]
MGFDGIIGQERAITILRLALRRGRLPQSLLFSGPEGVGKRRTAFALARALNCEQGGDEPCDACPQCRAVLAGMEKEERGSPDVKEILPGGKEEPPDEERRKNEEESGKDSIKVAQIRYVKYFAARRPLFGRKRVYIISQAEKMVEPARNAFLKVLEEPPPLTHFILLTAYPEQLPPTIISRCTRIPFGLIPREDIEKHLLSLGRDAEEARVLARLSRGSLDAALETDWEDVSRERREAWDILRTLLRRQGGADFLEDYGSLRRGEKTNEILRRLWGSMEVFLRDLLLVRESGDPGRLMNPDYEDDLKAEASRLSSGEIQAALDRVARSLAGLDRSLNRSLLVSAFYSDIIDR